MVLPSPLEHLRASDAGRAWLEQLPDLVADCSDQWSLELGEPFAYAYASVALPGTDAAGEQVVLKVQFPDRESEHEAAALALWDGDGAVRLLAYDEERRALLLERCRPGTSLSLRPAGEALDILVALLPRLWKPADQPFTSLATEAARWFESLEWQWERFGRPFERRLLDAALHVLTELPTAQGEQVLLHQDLHGGNVLRAEREPWLAIDPKPLVGEREFSLASVIRSSELGGRRRDVVHRLDRLTADLGLDRARARFWTICQTLAWAFDGTYLDGHARIARWLLEA